MKNLMYFFVSIAAFIFLLTGCSEKFQLPEEPANKLEKVTITDFTATEYPVQIIDPGTTKIVGQNIIVKGQVIESIFACDNSFVNGTAYITLNGMLNIYTGEGPLHGKLNLTPDAMPGNTWECNWTGYRTKTGESEWTLNLQLEGQGKGGELDGMKIFFDEAVIANDIYGQNGYVGSVTGYLKSE